MGAQGLSDNLSANAGDAGDSGSIHGLGRSLGDGSDLAWRIPWTEEPAGLQSMRSQKSQVNNNTIREAQEFNGKRIISSINVAKTDGKLYATE